MIFSWNSFDSPFFTTTLHTTQYYIVYTVFVCNPTSYPHLNSHPHLMCMISLSSVYTDFCFINIITLYHTKLYIPIRNPESPVGALDWILAIRLFGKIGGEWRQFGLLTIYHLSLSLSFNVIDLPHGLFIIELYIWIYKYVQHNMHSYKHIYFIFSSYDWIDNVSLAMHSKCGIGCWIWRDFSLSLPLQTRILKYDYKASFGISGYNETNILQLCYDSVDWFIVIIQDYPDAITSSKCSGPLPPHFCERANFMMRWASEILYLCICAYIYVYGAISW